MIAPWIPEDWEDEGLPDLPAWICARYGQAKPGDSWTGPGLSDPVEPWVFEWARGLAAASARRAELNAVMPEWNGDYDNLSALTGEKRDKAFEALAHFENDRSGLNSRWEGRAELRGKALWLLSQLQSGPVMIDDARVTRALSADELRELAALNVVSRIGAELIALGYVTPGRAARGAGSGDGGKRNVPKAILTAAVRAVEYEAELIGIGVTAPLIASVITMNKAVYGLEPGVHHDVTAGMVKPIRRGLKSAGAMTAEIWGRAYLTGDKVLAYCPETHTLGAEAREEARELLTSTFTPSETRFESGSEEGKNAGQGVDGLRGAARARLLPHTPCRHRWYWKRERETREAMARGARGKREARERAGAS